MFPGFPGEGAGRTRRGLISSTEVASGSNLSDILHPILARSRGELRAELESLARETDPRLFFEGLLGLGMRREAAGDLEMAAEIYAAVAGARDVGGAHHVEPLQTRAQRQLDAILGRGAAGPRFEFLARRFAREASDPTMLLAMTAGSAVFTLSRASILSRLLASPTRNFFTQGLGARALASGGAFLLEVPAFWATGKGLRELAAPGSQSWDLATNFHELAGAGLTLGALKLTGFAASSAYRRIAGPAGAERARPLQALLHQTGMFTGIVLGHRLEEAAGLRRPVDGATTLLDSLVMLLQFNVGGRLSHQILGPRWAGRVQEMELQLQHLATRPRTPRPPLDFGRELNPALATASGPRGGSGESLEALLSRPTFMMMEGEGGGNSAASRPWRGLFVEVSERGRVAEVQALRDLLQEILSQGERGYQRIAEKLSSRDHQEWRSAIRILGELLERDPQLVERLRASESLRAYSEDWAGRPHFAAPGEIRVNIARDTPRAHSLQQHFVPELQRALYENPNLRGWEAFLRGHRGRKELTRAQSAADPEGGTLVVADGPRLGLRLRFDAGDHLRTPVELRRAYTEAEWRDFSSPKPPPAAAEPSRAVSAALAPRAGENATLWAMRLLEMSREGETQALMVAQVLEARLRDPAAAPLAREAVDRLIALTDRTPEGQGILARRYNIPGVRDPLTIVSLPTTFLPEQWSRVFAEGIVQEFRRDGRTVDRAVEIGSGTGWVSILAAKLGMAREVIGVDRNPHAPVLGRLNAALNGVEGVRFQTSDLLTDLPEGMKADLILACLPQVPRNGGVESLRAVADYYPSEGTYWDRYGLGLIDRALGQARERLTEDGRILFNLGGRPGRPILEDLLARRGFHPGVRYGQLIRQDPTTDFSELARLEAGNRQRFEFFLKEDPGTPISAAEAMGRPEVYHMLYLTEGRPYANLLRSALAAETAQPRRLGYTPDPGSEHEGLRKALAAELGSDWGARLSPDLLFLGPSTDVLLEGLLRVSLPEGGRVLYSGAADVTPPAGLRRFNVIPMRPDPVALQNAVEAQRPDAVVLRLPREAWAGGEEFFPLFAAAVERRSHVVVLEDHPLPAQGRAHPAAQYLAEHPEALPYIHLVQSLDRRYQSPAFPLAVAMSANSSVQGTLARYGDVTYSRASSLVQGAYLRFLQELPRGVLPGAALHGSIEPVLAPSLPDSPVSRTLSSRAAFESVPKGEHPDPIDMSFGESEWRAPVRLDTAVLNALTRPREALDAEARAAVAQYLRESRGVDFAPEQIVLAAGVHPALEAAIRAVGAVEGRGVQVAVPQPSYGLFYPTIEIAGGRAAEFATRAEDRFLARPGMIPFADPGKGGRWVSALLLNEPTNPAGQYYSAEQWREIAGAIRAARGYLMFDDVFGMLDFGRIRGRRVPSLQTLTPELGPRLIAFGGVSKEFAAGGLRFGYAVTPNPRLAEAMRAELLAVPDPLALAAAPEYLSRWQELIQPHRFYLSSKAMALESVFAERHLPVVGVQGGYALFADLSHLHGRRLRLRAGGTATITPQNLHELLYSEAGLKVHAEDWARVRGHYRFVFSIERLDEAVQRLKLFFRSAR